MPGPTARRELVSHQTAMGVHAAMVGHCAITTLWKGVVPVPMGHGTPSGCCVPTQSSPA